MTQFQQITAQSRPWLTRPFEGINQIEARQQKRDAEDQFYRDHLRDHPPLLQSYWDAFAYNPTSRIINMALRWHVGNIAIDPNWQPTREEWDWISKDIPDEYRDRFFNATSLEHAQYIRIQTLNEVKSMENLQKQGFRGGAAKMAAEVLDPGFWLIGELLAPIMLPAKGAGLLGRLARGAMFAGTTVAPIEALAAMDDPQRDASSVIHVTLGAMIMGAGIEGLIGRRLSGAAEGLQKEIELAEARRAGMELSDKGRNYFWKQLSATEQRRHADELLSHMDLPDEELQRLLELPPDQLFNQMAAEGRIDPFASPKPPRRAIEEAPPRVGTPESPEAIAVRTENKPIKVERKPMLEPPGERPVVHEPLRKVNDSVLRPEEITALDAVSKSYAALDNIEREAQRLTDIRINRLDVSDAEKVRLQEMDPPDAIAELRDRGLLIQTEPSDPLFGELSKLQEARGNLETANRQANDLIGRSEIMLGANAYLDPLAKFIGSAVASGVRFTATHAVAAARWLVGAVGRGITNAAEAASMLVAKFGEGIRSYASRIWESYRNFVADIERRGGNIGALNADEVRRLRAAIEKGVPFDEAKAAVVAESQRMQEAGVQPEAPKVEPLEEPIERTLEDPPDMRAESTPSGAWGGRIDRPFKDIKEKKLGTRFDMGGMIKNSPVESMCRAGHILAADPLIGPKGEKSIWTLGEHVTWLVTRRQVEFLRRRIEPLKKWLEQRKATVINRDVEENNFYENITAAMRRPKGMVDNEPVNEMADFMAERFQHILEQVQRNHVPGFNDIPPNANYVPRMASLGKMDRIRDRLNTIEPKLADKALHDLLTGSLLSGSERLSREQAETLARVWLKLQNDNRWSDLVKTRMFSTDNTEQLALIIRSHFPELPEEQIDNILYENRLMRGDGGQKVMNRAKRRMDIDETYEMDVLDSAGNVVDHIAIEDLLENNIRLLYDSYVKQTAGAIVEQEFYRGMAREGEPPPRSIEAVKERIRDEGMAQGLSSRDLRQLDSDLQRLDTLFRMVTHKPIVEKKSYDWLVQRLKAINYLRIGGSMGYAQLADLGNIMGEATHNSFTRAMPIYDMITRRARDAEGNLLDPTMREYEVLWSSSTDMMRGYGGHRIELEEEVALKNARNIGDRALARATHAQMVLSGLGPIDACLQNGAYNIYSEMFAHIALNGRTPSLKRLASIGLDKEEAIAIAEQIRQYGNWTRGSSGTKLANPNVDAWADQALAAKFVRGGSKWARRAVQREDIGNLSAWMTKPTARLLIQFHIYPIVAWTKQFLFGLQMRDLHVGAAWSISMFFGALGYIALTYQRSIGRDDRQEYLARRLTPAAIGAAAFQRAGFSSILPGVIDSSLVVTGFDPWFQYARTTGLPTNALSGNPTFDLIDSGWLATRGIVAGSLQPGYQYSQDDLRQAARILPFANMMGVMNFINAISSTLPKQSESGKD